MSTLTTPIEQRSPEWFAQRKGRVTGSVAGAILGLNAHQSPDAILRRMVREYHGLESEFTGNIVDSIPTATSTIWSRRGSLTSATLF